MRTLLITVATLCHVGSAAQAQEVPPVFVLTEDDSKAALACQVSNTSSSAAVESELRYNRVPVATRAQGIRYEALRATVQSTPIQISGGCAAAYSFSLNLYQPVVLRVTGKEMWVTVEICSRSGIMSGPTYDLQSRLNLVFRDLTSECIAEYRKK